MRIHLCTAVLSSVLLGVFAYPADPEVPQPSKVGEGEKQPKQHLFGIGIDVNLNKNGTLIPSPSFVNTSGSYASGLGIGGNFVVPLIPFPLGLLFPHPPLNITLGFTHNKNVTASLVAATGNATTPESPQSPQGWGWGWSTTEAPGWSSTEGWNAPPPTEGWSIPETTAPGWGWEETTTTTTPGWGWGWGVRKGVKPNPSSNNPVKPHKPSAPIANPFNKPNLVPNSGESAKPAQPNNSPALLGAVSQPPLASELPSVDMPVVADPQQFSEATQPLAVENVLTEVVLESANEPALVSIPEPQVEIAPAAASVPESLLEAPTPEAPIETSDVKVSVPISPSAGKNKRHADVELPSALRISDFEDVESPNEMNIPAFQEHMKQEMSKEEMIIMAMEHNGPFGNQPMRPSLNQLHTMSKPTNLDDTDDSESVRNADSEEAQVSESPKSASKGKPEADPGSTGERGGRNKPRPYGMDKPSKSRPSADSGMKSEQFGLPHQISDYNQKDQVPIGSPSVLGFQVPDIKWSSITNILQSFLGSRQTKESMAKSDECVDEDDGAVSDVIRAPTIQLGELCQSSVGVDSCNAACVSSGFESGNCLEAQPTPECLCRIPNHKELAMMLSPLENTPEDLLSNDSPPCKKCACAESCKATGAYTGYCMEKCYCAVPWYTKTD